MSERTTLRLSEKLNKAIDTDFKQMGLASKNDYIIKALEHFLACKRADLSAKMRLIVLQWTANCKRCGDEVKAGNWALYGRTATGGIVICMDCYVERIGDKALVAKYLKLREYKQILKALIGECEKHAQKLEDFQLFDRLKDMEEKIGNMEKWVMDYLRKKLGTAEESQVLEELVRATKEVNTICADIRDLYAKLLKSKKSKVMQV